MSQLIKFEDQQSTLQKLVESKLLPSHINSVEKAFTVATMGAELGFSLMSSFHYIIPIQGRATLSAKAINALLTKAGVVISTIEDAVYVYKDESTSKNALDKPDVGKPIDQRTTLEFTRNNRTESVSFTWLDAVAAGLSEKD